MIICGIVWLITLSFFEIKIVFEEIIHKVFGFAQYGTIYYMLQKTGSGLRLVVHKLNNGDI